MESSIHSQLRMEKGTLYPHPVKTLFMFRGHTPCNQWKAAYTLSCAPDQLSGLDKSFNILTRHLLISKLGLLPPSSQRFCDYLHRMIVTITHKVASLPAAPRSVPHCPLLQHPSPPCSHFTDLAIHGGKNCYSSHPRAFASALYFYLESSSPIPVSLS